MPCNMLCKCSVTQEHFTLVLTVLGRYILIAGVHCTTTTTIPVPPGPQARGRGNSKNGA